MADRSAAPRVSDAVEADTNKRGEEKGLSATGAAIAAIEAVVARHAEIGERAALVLAATILAAIRCDAPAARRLGDEAARALGIRGLEGPRSPAMRFDLGLYGPGQSKSVTFDKPGAVAIFCSIHRYMDGVVYVSPTPYTSRVNPDGKYEIANVPPGEWIVKTWQRRKRFLEQTVPVTVEAGKPTDVTLELKRR